MALHRLRPTTKVRWKTRRGVMVCRERRRVEGLCVDKTIQREGNILPFNGKAALNVSKRAHLVYVREVATKCHASGGPRLFIVPSFKALLDAGGQTKFTSRSMLRTSKRARQDPQLLLPLLATQPSASYRSLVARSSLTRTAPSNCTPTCVSRHHILRNSSAQSVAPR